MLNERVWMHKKTGQLYEKFDGGIWGSVIAWEDLTVPERATVPITKDSPLMFDDEYNAEDYEDLGEL